MELLPGATELPIAALARNGGPPPPGKLIDGSDKVRPRDPKAVWLPFAAPLPAAPPLCGVVTEEAGADEFPCIDGIPPDPSGTS